MKLLVIVMGVSGCGKTTVAKTLAKQKNWQFIEADDFHSAAARAKMAAGIGLNDDDREPWIQSLCDYIEAQNEALILAYSGLRYQHRQRFIALGYQVCFIHLTADYHIIEARLQSRRGHFATASLLQSQYQALQPMQAGERCIELDTNNKNCRRHALDYINRIEVLYD